MQVSKDLVEDNILPKSKVFIVSNGPDRMIQYTGDFGEAIWIVPSRIDEYLKFDALKEQVERSIADYTEGDYILIGNNGIVLALAITELFMRAVPVNLLSYDFLTRTFRTYQLSEDGTWITKLPPPASHSS